MFSNLTFYLFFHSVLRWLLLAALLTCIVKSYIGYRKQQQFTDIDNSFRHWTATLAHMQLVFGIILYSQSPIVKYFWKNRSVAIHDVQVTFFSLVHILLMLSAIVLITIGSSLAKRKALDNDKFKTMFMWFVVALIIILIAIPWPFSPLAQRPYIRQF
jgi:uncharacterized membrane protein